MLDKPHTPPATLTRARRIALSMGLQYVYTGNVHDTEGGSTWCPGCGNRLIERDWYVLGEWNLNANLCKFCGRQIAGRFEKQPGKWGARRLPVVLAGRPRNVAHDYLGWPNWRRSRRSGPR
jgi:pyruvate formate lyase activating enzyme